MANLSVDFAWFSKLGIDYKTIVSALYQMFNAQEIKNFEYFKQIKTHDGNINVYTSGKVLFQGSFLPEDIEQVISYLLKTQKDLPDVFLGFDEAGKGERLGALVLGGYVVTKQNLPRLISLGVSDSKKLDMVRISNMIANLGKIGKPFVKIFPPEEFNVLWKQTGNLNTLMQKGYEELVKTTIEWVKKQWGTGVFVQLVVDRFLSSKNRDCCGVYNLSQDFKKFDFIHENKAEIYPAVAGASVFAKYNYELTKNKFSSKKAYK